MQLAQALGELMFEKSLREKVSQENSGVRWELGQLQQQLEVSHGSLGSRSTSICLLQGTEEENPGWVLWSTRQLAKLFPACPQDAPGG